MSSKSDRETNTELEHKYNKQLDIPQQLTSTADYGEEGSQHKMSRNQRQAMIGELEQHEILKSSNVKLPPVIKPSTDADGKKDCLPSISHIHNRQEQKNLETIQELDALSRLDLISELEMSFPPGITSQEYDFLKNRLYNLSYCPINEWDKKITELKLCISKTSEASPNYEINEFCNRMKQLLCPKTKKRPSPQIDIKQPDIKVEKKQTLAMISNLVMTPSGAVINSFDQMTICCYMDTECSQTINCCSLVTDMTRVRTTDKVIASLPFSKKIVIISHTGSQLLNLTEGYRNISHVEGSKFVGSHMFSRTLYLVDWKMKLEDGIIRKFEIKDYPSDIAVGPRQHILTTFINVSYVSCYNLKGEVLFELDSVSKLPLKMPTSIFANRIFFYIIVPKEKQINRVSALGGVSQVKIPIEANNMAIGKNNIILWDIFGKSCILETEERFWPNQIYFNQTETPTIDRQLYIDNATEVKAILMVSDSRVVLIYLNKQIELIDANNIEKTLLDSLQLDLEPTAFCRWNATQILVTFSENKIICFVSWDGDDLKNKDQLEMEFGYVQVTNKANNEVVGLTVGPQPQVHMISTTDDGLTVKAVIKLEHSNISIAASPVNLLVADIDNCKLVFFSFCGKQISEKRLKIKHRPWLVYSNGNHFYVVSASKPSVDCYNICGQFEQEFELASHCLPQIAVLNGALSVVDTLYSRVLFYRHHNWDRCQVQVKNESDIRTVDIRYGKRKEKKAIIGAMCLLLDGQLAIADWGEYQLLLISRHGDIVKQYPLPSLATDICRWDDGQFGVLLPLEKQLWLIKNNSFDKRVISLIQSYIRVCKFDDTRAVCYCDQPSCLDLVTVEGSFQRTFKLADSLDYVQSIAVRHDTKDILTWNSSRLLSYKITNNSPEENTIFQQTQSPLGGGCIDETLLYVTDRRRVFSLTSDSQIVAEYFGGDKLGVIDQVDVMSGYIVVTEFLSSTVYFQDLAMTERGHYYTIPHSSEDTEDIEVTDVAITDNNLIAVCDKKNKNLKILSFKGMLLGTLALESSPLCVCQWIPNTLAVTFHSKKTLLTLKVQFPLSHQRHDTDRNYRYIAALSDGRLVCSWRIRIYKSGINIVDIKNLNIYCKIYIEGEIRGLAVIHQDIIAVASWDVYSILHFFNCSGEKLYEVDNSITQILKSHSITSNDTYIYVAGDQADLCSPCVVCLSHEGHYNNVFLHHTQPIMPNIKERTTGGFKAVDCRGSRIVVSTGSDLLYVQGLTINRETFPVSRLQGDMFPVKIKDLDISAQGKTIMCDLVNNIIKLFTCDGQLICHKSLGVLAGGLCFMGETHAMVTVPHLNQLFSLDVSSLDIVARWNTQVPYGRIHRLNQNLFLCLHINLTELHTVKVVGDNLEIAKKEILNQCPFSLPPDITESEVKEEIDSKDRTYSTGRNRSTDREHTLHFQGSQQNDGRQRLRFRCDNFVVSSTVGSDTISVRQLPWRNRLFCLPTKSRSTRVHVTLLTDDTIVISDYDNKTITLTTLEGYILHQIPTDTEPGDICQWTDDTFIVTFFKSKSLVFYNREHPQSPIRTIYTKKGYDYVCKYNDSQLVCCARGDTFHTDGAVKYRDAYMAVLSVESGSVMCSTVFARGLVLDIGVTDDSVVVLKGIMARDKGVRRDSRTVLCWYTGQGLHQYKHTDIFMGKVIKDPKQIAIHGKKVYLLEGGVGLRGRIYCISSTDSCEIYLDRKQIDCEYINSIDISGSRLIITGEILTYSTTSSALGVRAYDI